MAQILDKFLSATTNSVSDYYKNEIKHFVISYPNITEKHGKSGISNLKLECKEALNNLPIIIKDNLDIEKFWPHKMSIEELEKSYRETYSIHIPKFINYSNNHRNYDINTA